MDPDRNPDLHELFSHPQYRPKGIIHRNGRVSVVRARHRRTGELVAVKCYARPLTEYDMKALCRSCYVHSRLRHQCIVDFKEVFSTPRYFGVAMSHVSGRTLREHVQSHFAAHGYGMEPQAAHTVLYQVAHAFAYMQTRNTAYRYIKPDHVFVCDDNLTVKLIDFLRSRFGANYCTTKVGEVHHIAPEIFIGAQNERWYPDMDLDAAVEDNPYSGEKLDVWGLGVLFYYALYARFPFNAPDNGQPDAARMRALINSICDGEVQFPTDRDVPSRYTELMRRMLTKDPVERISLAEIRGIDWFNEAPYLPQIQDLSMLGPTQASF